MSLVSSPQSKLPNNNHFNASLSTTSRYPKSPYVRLYIKSSNNLAKTIMTEVIQVAAHGC